MVTPVPCGLHLMTSAHMAAGKVSPAIRRRTAGKLTLAELCNANEVGSQANCSDRTKFTR